MITVPVFPATRIRRPVSMILVPARVTSLGSAFLPPRTPRSAGEYCSSQTMRRTAPPDGSPRTSLRSRHTLGAPSSACNPRIPLHGTSRPVGGDAERTVPLGGMRSGEFRANVPSMSP